MESLDYAQLIRIISDEHINFIATAVTPWHAHGIDAAIRYLEDSNIHVNGIILVQPAVKQSEICYILSENHFVTRNCKIYTSPAIYNTCIFYIIKKLFLRYKAKQWYNFQSQITRDKTIYIVSPWHLDIDLFVLLYKSFFKTYHFEMILVEEGLSTYFPKIDTNKHIWSLLALRKKGVSLILSFIFAFLEKYLRNRFEFSTSWVNLNLLIRQDGRLYPNNLSIKYYRQVLEIYSKKIRTLTPVLNIKNNSVVICTMAYLHSEVKEHSDVSTLKQVVSELKNKGLNIYLKPHPRDLNYRNRYSSLDCEFIDFPYSIEVLLIIYPQIQYIVSFSSTSLVTAKLLLGLNSVSVLNLLEKDKYGQYIIDEMESFTNCFSDMIDMPNSIEEFRSYFHGKY